MKRLVPYILCVVCVPVCFADFGDADDGYLTAGEYDYNVSVEGIEQLIVMGGGASSIDARDHSYIEVQYTSTPLSNSSGIYDIFLEDYSELLYLDGITEEITLYDDAKAHLKGGRIDGITLYRRPVDSTLVTIYCQEGWSWLSDNTGVSGITGLWENGTSFDIQFVDHEPYPAAWNYIDVVEIVPEPTTLTLLGLGGLLIRKRKT